MNGKDLSYGGVVFSDYNVSPVITAGSDAVYVFDVKKFDFGFPFVVVAVSREPVFHKCSSVETGEQKVTFQEQGRQYRTQYMEYHYGGYPHEDTSIDKIVSRIIY